MITTFINIECGIPIVGILITLITFKFYNKIFVYSIFIFQLLNLLYRILLYFDEPKWIKLYLSETPIEKHYSQVIFTYDYLSIVMMINLISGLLLALLILTKYVKK